MLPEVERFRKWLRRRNPDATTPIHYTSDLELFFTRLDKPLTQVSVMDIDRFIEHSQTQGHANATINRRLAAIHSLYHFLSVESDSAPRNPVVPKRHMIRQGRRLPRDVEDAVLEKLFAVITLPRDRCMFLLMLRCGLRVGEIRNLSLDDVHLQTTRGTHSVPRLRVRGKNSDERIVYLSAQAQMALKTWLATRPQSKDEALFLNRFNQRFTVTGIQDRLMHYCHLTGTWVTCHQLRHTFGRHLAEARVPVTTIQRLFGHARLRTTELYVHLSDPNVQASYEAAMVEITRRLPLDGGVP